MRAGIRPLAFGFLLTFLSSFGQSFFIGLLGRRQLHRPPPETRQNDGQCRVPRVGA